MRLTAVLCLLCACLVAGCGGGGGSSINQFAGTWSGTYNPEAWYDYGAGITVNADGEYTGTLTNHATLESGVLAGTIAPNGTLTGTVTYADRSYTVTGNVRLGDTDNEMLGAVVISDDGTPVESGNIDLEK